MRNTDSGTKTRLRTVFLSDVHLGCRDCRARELLDFLGSVEVDYLYLVGDIVDFWSLRKSFYWPQEHNEVLRVILDMAREGTEVTYIPGNHDEDLREFCGSVFGNMRIRRRSVHSTADGREFLVLHGDEFDTAVKCSRWLARFGAVAYDVTMRINRSMNWARRQLGLGYWSLAGYLKLRLPNAVRYVEAFEHAAAQAAVQRDLDGVVCGHIHRAGIREIDGVTYCNDGDWVENCSALIEDMNGRLALWTLQEASATRRVPAPIEAAA